MVADRVDVISRRAGSQEAWVWSSDGKGTFSVAPAALAHAPANRVVVAPDCGMKYLPRAVAFGKMKAMAEGAALVRRELQG